MKHKRNGSVKSLVAVALCMALAASLAGCTPKRAAAGSAPAASSSAGAPFGDKSSDVGKGAQSAAALPAGTLPSIPEGFKPTSTADFLPDELWQLYLDGYAVYINFFSLSAGMGFVHTGAHDSTNPDYTDDKGNIYWRAEGPLAKWDDFVAYVQAAFIDFDQLNGANGPRYIEVDGYVYYMDGERGSNGAWVKDMYEPVSQSESRVEFRVVGMYTPDASPVGYEDSPSFSEEELVSEAYPIVMVKTADGWRIDTFNITF